MRLSPTMLPLTAAEYRSLRDSGRVTTWVRLNPQPVRDVHADPPRWCWDVPNGASWLASNPTPNVLLVCGANPFRPGDVCQAYDATLDPAATAEALGSDEVRLMGPKVRILSVAPERRGEEWGWRVEGEVVEQERA